MKAVNTIACLAAAGTGFWAVSALAAPSLQMMPPVAGQTTSEARAITADGRYVAGNSGTSGVFWDSVTAPAASTQVVCGGNLKTPSGIAVRTYNGQTEIAVAGLQDSPATNAVSISISADGGTTWTKSFRNASYTAPNFGAANTLKAASAGSDVLYTSFTNAGAYAFTDMRISGANANSGSMTTAVDVKSTNTGSELTVNGVSSAGLGVGSRAAASVAGYTGVQKQNYYMMFNGGGTSGIVNFFKGLDGTTNVGEAFAAAGNNLTGKVFGRSPNTVGGTSLYPYMYSFATGLTTQLPMFGDEAGSTVLFTVYGCSDDGRYVVGQLYRGSEKAVLWDTTLNTVTDLTQFATNAGIIGGFTKLARGFSVGIDASGNPVVAGLGSYNDNGTILNRGFVMTVPEPTTALLLVAGGLFLRRRRTAC